MNTDVVNKLTESGVIDHMLERIVEQHTKLFQGVGRAKIEPIHIYMDSTVKPTQQKQRKVAIYYLKRFERHLKELKDNEIVSGPLDSEDATGWISNPVITGKRCDSEQIRINLDLREMEKAAKPSHFLMLTSEDLQHKFEDSDTYSVLDMNHAYHQFALDKASKHLFVFYTPWGLYKYNRLAMGIHTVSSECQEKLRLVLHGLEGVQQI